jgi:hypothetical protein
MKINSSKYLPALLRNSNTLHYCSLHRSIASYTSSKTICPRFHYDIKKAKCNIVKLYYKDYSNEN